MRRKRIFALTLAAVFGSTLLSSCTQREPFEFEFCDESDTKKYTSVTEGSAMTVYVDVNANDGGDGSEKSPFKTIAEAQAKIRDLKAGEGLPAGGITVLIKDGEYRLSESLTFTEADSGTAECPITYVSENEFGAVLTGGLILSASDFEPLNEDERSRLLDETAKDKVVKVDLTKYGLTETDWGLLYSRGGAWGSNYENGVGPAESEIFIDGERLVLSRYPNDDFVRTYKLIDTGVANEYFSETEFDSRGQNRYAPEDRNIMNAQGGIFTVRDSVKERLSKWYSLDDVWAFGYFKWSWSDAALPIKSIDLETSTIEFAQAVNYGVSSNAPFYFYNVFDEMDMPGEYYIDRTNGILYVYKTETFDTAEIVMSCSLDNIINMKDAHNIVLKGFSICATRANGVSISGNNITVDICKIYNIRGGALSANGTDITVQNCELCNLGAYGISISGGDGATLTSSNNLIYNNYIHDFGIVQRTYQSAVSVGGCGATVSHNEIANSPHQAISWGGPNHLFEYNEVYNVCTETSDCGAFYTGKNFTSYGCVLRYNYIHDVGTGDVSAFGIYWDDGLSGQTAYGNVIVNSASSAFLIGGGRDNVIENNIIINAGDRPIAYDARSRDSLVNNGWVQPGEVVKMTVGLIDYQKLDIWNETFPIYSKIIPYTADFSGDYDDPLFSANPSNNSIKNNVSYYFNEDLTSNLAVFSEHNINEAVYRFSDVENNPIIKYYIADFRGLGNEDYTMSEHSKAKELCPDFELIPFDKIGRE